MKRLVTAAALALFGSHVLADSAADAAFEVLTEQYLSDLAHFSPVVATLIGDHSADDQLDQADAEARSKNAVLYNKYLGALDEISVDSLSRANQVDAELLRAELQSSLWSLETLQEWAWNTGLLPGTSHRSISALQT